MANAVLAAPPSFNDEQKKTLDSEANYVPSQVIDSVSRRILPWYDLACQQNNSYGDRSDLSLSEPSKN